MKYSQNATRVHHVHEPEDGLTEVDNEEEPRPLLPCKRRRTCIKVEGVEASELKSHQEAVPSFPSLQPPTPLRRQPRIRTTSPPQRVPVSKRRFYDAPMPNLSAVEFYQLSEGMLKQVNWMKLHARAEENSGNSGKAYFRLVRRFLQNECDQRAEAEGINVGEVDLYGAETVEGEDCYSFEAYARGRQ